MDNPHCVVLPHRFGLGVYAKANILRDEVVAEFDGAILGRDAYAGYLADWLVEKYGLARGSVEEEVAPTVPIAETSV